MSPKDLVLQGYKLFSEGKIEELGKQWHQDAKIHVNGDCLLYTSDAADE